MSACPQMHGQVDEEGLMQLSDGTVPAMRGGEEDQS